MGFDVVRFRGEVDEELICPICSGVLEEPLQVSINKIIYVHNSLVIQTSMIHQISSSNVFTCTVFKSYPYSLLKKSILLYTIR